MVQVYSEQKKYEWFILRFFYSFVQLIGIVQLFIGGSGQDVSFQMKREASTAAIHRSATGGSNDASQSCQQVDQKANNEYITLFVIVHGSDMYMYVPQHFFSSSVLTYIGTELMGTTPPTGSSTVAS